DARVAQLSSKILDDLAALRGVKRAAITDRLPVLGGQSTTPVRIEGVDVPRPADQPWASVTLASVGFFDVTGISITAGRSFEN
ncbi:hypothetical protein, partial [Salmonella enterica]|uniref:hypothetical protein n=1 Tax=Salmonella enterica TaxID=28901 RepID=UPI0020C24C4D